MLAYIEKPDGTYERRELQDPECGEAYCDNCGDCLHCYASDCYDGEYCGNPMWVIYLSSPKNPYREVKKHMITPTDRIIRVLRETEACGLPSCISSSAFAISNARKCADCARKLAEACMKESAEIAAEARAHMSCVCGVLIRRALGGEE